MAEPSPELIGGGGDEGEGRACLMVEDEKAVIRKRSTKRCNLVLKMASTASPSSTKGLGNTRQKPLYVRPHAPRNHPLKIIRNDHPPKGLMKISDLPYSERPESWKKKHRATNKRYKHTAKGREKRRAEKRRHYQKHREEEIRKTSEKAQANRKMINAQRLAEKYVPLGEECEECGSKEQLERHHPDYNRPKGIQTLCKRCHQAKHS
jgi:hypothetical protein